MELKERIAKLEAELNELKAELEEQKYCLNVFTEKPQREEKYWVIFSNGEIDCSVWWDNDGDIGYFENTILFKNQKSAETYLELRQDMKRLSKEFEHDGDNNYLLYYNHAEKEVCLSRVCQSEYSFHFFTKENAQYILNKYGQEVLKNYILYCK